MDSNLAAKIIDSPDSAQTTLQNQAQKVVEKPIHELTDKVSKTEDSLFQFPKIDFNPQPLNGSIDIKDTSSGATLCRMAYKDGILHGLGEILDEEGNTTITMNYKNGQLSGPYERYDQGILQEKLCFKDGKLHGTCEYYSNGTKQMEMPFENGSPTGEVRSYGDDGKLMSSTFFKNGTQHGPQIIYAEDGNVSAKFNYYEGKRQGKSTLFYPSGKILEEGGYNQGRKDGTFMRYYENGNVNTVSHFKDDKLLEVPISFDPQGNEIED